MPLIFLSTSLTSSSIRTLNYSKPALGSRPPAPAPAASTGDRFSALDRDLVHESRTEDGDEAATGDTIFFMAFVLNKLLFSVFLCHLLAAIDDNGFFMSLARM